MGKRRTAAWSTTTPMNNISKDTFGKNSNLFHAIEDEADVFPFFRLPRELRDEIYMHVLDDVEIKQKVLYGDAYDPDPNDLPFTYKPQLTGSISHLILANKQMSFEIQQAVPRYVPLLLDYNTIPPIDDHTDPSNALVFFCTPKFGAGSPSVAHMSIEFFHQVWIKDTAEEMLDELLESVQFKDLTHRLAQCTETTHPFLRCHIQTVDDIWEAYEEDFDPLDTEVGKCTKVYDHVHSIIRSLPEVLRYGIEVIIESFTAHAQVGYSQRRQGTDWGFELPAKLMHNKCPLLPWVRHGDCQGAIWRPGGQWCAF